MKGASATLDAFASIVLGTAWFFTTRADAVVAGPQLSRRWQAQRFRSAAGVPLHDADPPLVTAMSIVSRKSAGTLFAPLHFRGHNIAEVAANAFVEAPWNVTDSSAVTIVDGNQTHVVVVTNSTNRPLGNSTEKLPFADIKTTHVRGNTTIVEVKITTPNVIISTYLLMFVPLAMAWVMVLHYGLQETYFLLMLPLTLCVLIVGMDLVNQTLSILMDSPCAITLLQGLSMFVLTGIWTCFSEARQPSLSRDMCRPLASWSVVSATYAAYQLVTHSVSYYCSLSERTVFANLCPVTTLMIERMLMPPHARPETSFPARMALSAMVFGAMLFGIQYPRFTPRGVWSGGLLMVCTAFVRIVQRRFIVEYAPAKMPIASLAFWDSMAIVIPTLPITVAFQDALWSTCAEWLRRPTIVLLLVLSWANFAGCHLVSLKLLSVASATSFNVYDSISSFVKVLLGIVLFSDHVGNPVVLAGLLISLGGGLWYASEVQRRRQEAEAASSPTAGRTVLESDSHC